MGLPVRRYSYTDAGAPQLTSGSIANWIAILKKVLITGYGTQPPLGWTLEFENTAQYKVVFRNSPIIGTGGYVQFSANNNASSATTMLIKGALNMSAVDIFIKPLPQRAITLSTKSKGWEIIGNERGFYLIQHYTFDGDLSMRSTSITQVVYFIGDIESIYPNDQTCFTIASADATLTDKTTTSSDSLSNTGSISCPLYSLDGDNHIVAYTTSLIYSNTPVGHQGDAELMGIPQVLSNTPVYCNIDTVDSSGIIANFSQKTPYYRGQLPGLWSSSFSGYANNTWPVDRVLDGLKIYTLLRGSYELRLWVDTEEWYA